MVRSVVRYKKQITSCSCLYSYFSIADYGDESKSNLTRLPTDVTTIS